MTLPMRRVPDRVFDRMVMRNCRHPVRLTSEAVVECSECFGEGPFEPGEMVGFAVVVGGEGVVAVDGGVAYVVSGAADDRAHVMESVGVGHGPGPTAADVDG